MKKRKTYGLVGTNGCGKTMLLKAICGFVSPTVGSVTVNGTVLGNSVYAQNVGVIIENVRLWANLTAFENLKILSLASGKANDDDIKKYISLFGLDPESKEKYKNFSLGMKQKLCLAQAFAEDPDLFILDEPTNALDAKTTNVFYDCVKSEKEKGKTVLLASHIEEAINSLCDYIVRMEDGKIIQIQECEGT